MIHLERFVFGNTVGFLFAMAWEVITCRVFKIGHLAKPKGLHLHHSLFGPGAWLVLPGFFDFGSMITLGLGLGVILQHAMGEGLAFITKEAK